MEHFVLFIRDREHADIAQLHPDEASVETALIAYVRGRERLTGAVPRLHDDEAVAAWSAREERIYAIARAVLTPQAENDR
ncbi:hypothetical protein [Novosphingobium sp. ST904]|uniref:hypothetical protein n=1 Tax=Novosphingobium sp. ST904 TaxID=1684385 RepID=UPI0006C84581|nr:hypothetical protein [Novosphingobium sp. ST904]KPH63578.1 hypothetical protein ADT71_13175 [Novosphingobium sp. ST904]TCM32345.1 hypothetical protein EDF59_12440 [Novosphingobium sp. ST904]